MLRTLKADWHQTEPEFQHRCVTAIQQGFGSSGPAPEFPDPCWMYSVEFHGVIVCVGAVSFDRKLPLLHDFCTIPEYRKCGVAGRLLNDINTDLKSFGFTSLTAVSWKGGGQKLLKWYMHRGFKKQRKLKNGVLISCELV